MTEETLRAPHPAVTGIWFHGRQSENMAFDIDRPAFFTCEREGVEMFSGRQGFVLEAELLATHPCRETDLLTIASELGLPDVFSDDYTDFPDVSTYLENPDVRRELEKRGFDGYVGEDGYLYVVIVWDPDLIKTISVNPFSDGESQPRPR